MAAGPEGREQDRVVTRADLFDVLNGLQARVHGLEELIRSRLQEQAGGGPDEAAPRCCRSRVAAYYLDAVFRSHVLAFSAVYAAFCLGVVLVLESAYLGARQLRAALGVLAALDAVLVAATCLVSVEQITRLIRRKARLLTMIHLYLALLLQFATLYTIYEVVDPGSFSGISYYGYGGVLRPVQLFLDFLYFSNVCQASVGFGDVAPTSGYGRFTVFVQSLMSVAFLAVLFSNWIS